MRTSSDIILLDNCLSIAGKFNGRVFGGYVRDVIIPRSINPSCDVKFNDVDIWFTTQEDADIFIENVGVFLKNLDIDFKLSSSGSLVPGEKNYKEFDGAHILYKFGRLQYHLIHNKFLITWIDIIVSKTIPVDDFNVNCLTYCYQDGNKIPKSFGNESTEQLIKAISDKHATMLLTYVKKLISYPKYEWNFVKRINNNFIKKGWLISYLSNKYQISTPIIDEGWMKIIFRSRVLAYIRNLESELKILTYSPVL